ncbi:MAG: hypothetical protein HZA78_09085 [Candidatus Schekmanbacteria bacterium]|nr:hypothetical protein [Candidatus Schekmanbacteria bacterium]
MGNLARPVFAHPGPRDAKGGHTGPDGQYHYHLIGNEQYKGSKKSSDDPAIPPKTLVNTGPSFPPSAQQMLPSQNRTPGFVDSNPKVKSEQMFPFRKNENDHSALTAVQNTGLVIKVFNADTLSLEINGQKEIVKLVNLNVPDSNTEVGRACSDYMAGIVEGKVVIIRHNNMRNAAGELLADIIWNGIEIKKMMQEYLATWEVKQKK